MNSILIIEDDSAYRSMMTKILQMEGFEVRSASDGTAGLNLISEKRPDLILCDIMMPHMDGHSVLEVLRGREALSEIPFIFVTALGERYDVRRGMTAGADDYLAKPFSAAELLSAVTSRIRRFEAFSPQSSMSDFKEEELMLFHKVTKREREVLLMVAQGATSREIAAYLGVSLKTVDVHRGNLLSKLDAPNAANLARWAVLAQLIE